MDVKATEVNERTDRRIAPQAAPRAATVEREAGASPLRIVGEVLFWLALGAAFVFFLFPLFWMIITTHWPETASNTSGHDGYIDILVFSG